MLRLHTIPRRWAIGLVIVELLVLLAMIVALLNARYGLQLPWISRQETNLVALNGKPAPEFRLKDQFGNSVKLSDLRGKVVVLTFLYTSCQDTCPLIAEKLAAARTSLGDRSDDLALVAVTVDPKRDTVQRVREFVDAQGLTHRMHFLTGDQKTLAKVWRDYYVGVVIPPQGGDGTGFYDVGHDEVLYFIDKAGKKRKLIIGAFEQDDVTRVAEQLLKE